MGILTIKLQRLETSPQGTFGLLKIDGHSFYSLELPWRDNAPNVSCIPAGSYKSTMTYSPRFKRQMYLLEGVKGRAGVRIHPANLSSQLNGCLALGLRRGQIDGVKAVLLSQPAIRQFEQILDGKDFVLEIKE